MRAVFVNHLHPEVPHVGATRVREFAYAMARRGHQIVLLTESLGPQDIPMDPQVLVNDLKGHDWSRPFLLSCPPRISPALGALRSGRLPRPARILLILWHYLRHGGVFTDWMRGSRPYWSILAQDFKPQVTWGSFGNTDAWRIAQSIARLAGCPWVADIKDCWDVFIPFSLRTLLAKRYSDSAWITGLSQSHLDKSGTAFAQPKQVVYSGFPSEMLQRESGPAPWRITVTGSLYSASSSAVMIEGMRKWLSAQPQSVRDEVVLTYAGADHARMRVISAALGDVCRLEILGFVPLMHLARLQREAFLNIYARHMNSREVFHHKVMELLTAQRPIASIPEEIDEAKGLADQVRGSLWSCEDAQDMASALDRAWRQRGQPVAVDHAALSDFTWDGQALRLEAVLAAAIAKREVLPFG